MPEEIVVAAAMGVFTLGAVFAVIWSAFIDRLFRKFKGQSCPHCGDTDVSYKTDWHAENAQEAATAHEFVCQKCGKSHWL